MSTTRLMHVKSVEAQNSPVGMVWNFGERMPVHVVRERINILFLFETVTVSDNRQQWSSDSFMGGTNF
ncbi:hypothetical protein TNCV_1843831 [Trichonephila clavipes]|nr:hypothetical protein TNCV_1843831 [Trichonephila clavipes]